MEDSLHVPLIRDLVRQMGNTFHTKDISEHPQMLTQHGLTLNSPDLGGHNTAVGRYLSKHRAALKIDNPDRAKNHRGALWVKI